jgi:hypothetical protein
VSSYTPHEQRIHTFSVIAVVTFLMIVIRCVYPGAIDWKICTTTAKMAANVHRDTNSNGSTYPVVVSEESTCYAGLRLNPRVSPFRLEATSVTNHLLFQILHNAIGLWREEWKVALADFWEKMDQKIGTQA